MYNGPFYYHQPGTNQHNRAYDLLYSNMGDGVIVTANEKREKPLESLIRKCHAISKPVILDVPQYDPNTFNAPGQQAGSELLLDPAIRIDYVRHALERQHKANASTYIIPNFETFSISQSWFQIMRALAETASEWINTNGDDECEVFLTIAVPSTDIANSERRQALLNQMISLRKLVHGFFINVTDIPLFEVDETLLRNLMHLVFRLKWQEFKIILSKAGPWVPLMFPLGLDIFGNDGFQSQQQVRTHRVEPRKGGRPLTYVPVWSPSAMSYIRYPDDAQSLYSSLPPSEMQNIWGRNSVFAPPIDRDPDDIYSSGKYRQPRRLNHFSADMAQMAQRYRGLGLYQRIEAVQHQVMDALKTEQEIGKMLGTPNRGREKTTWLATFNRFIEDNQSDLEELFG
jgi:hypothetical protein